MIGRAGEDRGLRGAAGFAVLSALLVTAIVLLAAAGLLSVASSMVTLGAADADAHRARLAAEEGVALAAESLRWGWLASGATASGVAADRGAFAATVTEIDADASPVFDEWPSGGVASPVARSQFRLWSVASTGRFGSAERTVAATLVTTPDALPRGVVVAGDVRLQAAMLLESCGVYAGGDVDGREHVGFAVRGGAFQESGAEVPDLAYGALYDRAAVHTRGEIRGWGADVHVLGTATAAEDDDRHTAGGPPASLLATPNAPTGAAFSTHSTPPGPALTGRDLSLTLLPPGGDAAGTSTEPGSGHIVVVDGDLDDVPLTVTGDLGTESGAAPLTLIVSGDCVLGSVDDPGAPVAFRGAIVVSGRVTVVAPTRIVGGLQATALEVGAQLVVTVDDGDVTQGQECAPGASNVHSAAWLE